MYIFFGGHKKDLILRFNDGITRGSDRAILAVDRSDSGLDCGQVVAQSPEFATHQRSGSVRLNADQLNPPAGKIHHLQGARVLDQVQYVLRDNVLGANNDIDRYGVVPEYFGMGEVFGRADAGDLLRRVVE